VTEHEEPSSTHVVRLRSADGSVTVLVHRSTKPGYKPWQVTYFHDSDHLSDTSFDHFDDALHALTSKGFIIDKAI
jgi:hypothetical protein